MPKQFKRLPPLVGWEVDAFNARGKWEAERERREKAHIARKIAAGRRRIRGCVNPVRGKTRSK